LASDLLGIGKSGLFAAKQSMATTSHNIANANTDGFSRQEVRTETAPSLETGHYVIGTGVEIQSIKRSHDELIEKKLNLAISQNQFNQERTTRLGEIEEIFNEINSDGLNKVLNRFFNSFRELSNQPDNETVREIVRENAKIVVDDFKRLRGDLNESRERMNNKIKLSIDEMNNLTKQIAKLNTDINVEEVNGGMANDLRDQRDRALRTLSEFVPLHCYSDSNGQFVVSIDGVGSIVAGSLAQEFATNSQVEDGKKITEPGTLDIYFKNRPSVSIGSKIKTGTIGALLKTRNDELGTLEKQLDELAHGLALSTNAIHRRGFKNGIIRTDELGQPTSTEKITGINFFKEPLDLHRAAEFISLSDDVKSDVNNICTAAEVNKPGDNRIALGISKLQHEKILGGGTTSFEEQYLTSVSKVGLQTGKSKIDLEQSQGILTQAKSIKERLAGVSLDEEAANMVRYQNAYEASAKMIKAADEMFQAVLGIMR